MGTDTARGSGIFSAKNNTRFRPTRSKVCSKLLKDEKALEFVQSELDKLLDLDEAQLVDLWKGH